MHKAESSPFKYDNTNAKYGQASGIKDSKDGVAAVDDAPYSARFRAASTIAI